MSDYIEQQDNLDLEDDQVEIEIDDSDEAEQHKQEQKAKTAQGLINSFQRKIDSGQVSLEEAPQWMINDLKPAQKTPVVDDSVKAQIKAEMKDELAFEEMQKNLPEITPEQADNLNAIIAEEVKLGKSKTQALKYAMFETGIKLEESHNSFTNFPIIRPRTFEKKQESLVKTSTDKAFLNTLESVMGKKIEL